MVHICQVDGPDDKFLTHSDGAVAVVEHYKLERIEGYVQIISRAFIISWNKSKHQIIKAN